ASRWSPILRRCKRIRRYCARTWECSEQDFPRSREPGAWKDSPNCKTHVTESSAFADDDKREVGMSDIWNKYADTAARKHGTPGRDRRPKSTTIDAHTHIAVRRA